MKYQIDQKDRGLKIAVTGAEGQEDQLAQNFAACQAGNCDCPTEEYQKLAGMEIEQQSGKITLSLTAKEGERLDPEEVGRCLEFTKNKLNRAPQ